MLTIFSILTNSNKYSIQDYLEHVLFKETGAYMYTHMCTQTLNFPITSFVSFFSSTCRSPPNCQVGVKHTNLGEITQSVETLSSNSKRFSSSDNTEILHLHNCLAVYYSFVSDHGVLRESNVKNKLLKFVSPFVPRNTKKSLHTTK